MTFTKTLIASAVALCALHAQALTWSITGGAYSSQAGALHETFGGLPADSNEALDLSYSGGALFNDNARRHHRAPAGLDRQLPVGGHLG